MEWGPKKAAAHRERIIEAASALFRAKGFDGIGVADIMKAADLTHGGFYGHFSSKDDLIAQASGRAMRQAAKNWGKITADGHPVRARAHALSRPAPARRPGQGLRLRRAERRRGPLPKAGANRIHGRSRAA